MAAGGASPPARRRGLGAGAGDTGTYLFSLVLLVGLWELVGRLLRPSFLPPFSDVAARLARELSDGPLVGYLGSSLTNLVLGFVLSALLGVTVGILMGLFEPVETALDVYVYGLMAAPSIVFVPVYFTLFGLSRTAIIALIVQYAVFGIIVNTMTGVKQVSAELMDMSRVFGASRRQVVRLVVLPSALPLTMAGLRVGMARSLKGMVNGELLIALIGLGGQLVRYGNVFDAEGVLAVILLIMIASLVVLRGMRNLDQRLTGWLPTSSG